MAIQFRLHGLERASFESPSLVQVPKRLPGLLIIFDTKEADYTVTYGAGAFAQPS
jgi:hypothetical protein